VACLPVWLVPEQRPGEEPRIRPAPDSGPYGGPPARLQVPGFAFGGRGIGFQGALRPAASSNASTPLAALPSGGFSKPEACPGFLLGESQRRPCPLLRLAQLQSCAAGGVAASPCSPSRSGLPLLAVPLPAVRLRLPSGHTPKSDYNWRKRAGPQLAFADRYQPLQRKRMGPIGNGP